MAAHAGESFTFYVDSSMRDPDAWPTPSEYEIAFAKPLKDVFSVALIDASVPRTEYVVERGSNTLAWSRDASPEYARAVANGTLVVTRIDPGDYNLPQLVQALNDALAPDALAVEPVSNPPEVTSRLRFTGRAPFTVFARDSGLRSVVGFPNATNVAGDDTNDDGTVRYAGLPTRVGAATNHTYASVPQTDPEDVRVFQGPLVVPVSEYAEALEPGRAVRQRLSVASAAIVTRATVAVTTADPSATLTVTIRNAATDAVLDVGSVALDPDQESASVAFAGGAAVDVGDTLAVELSVTGTATAYRAEGISGSTGVAIDAGSGGAWAPLDAAGQDLCVDIFGEWTRHAIETPAPTNLTGARFVLIRSPDVEAQIARDRAFEKTSAGLGLCKLSGSGYRDTAFSFTAFQPRRFHPVNLARLRVRLEKPDGRLYDAHGIDHTLVFAVQCGSTPTGAAAPDLHKMLIQRWTAELGE